MSDGGTYTVTVTAGHNEYTSLTSRASASISLTVDPRPLTVEWKLDGGDMAGSYVYDGSAHTVSVEVSGLVNDDTLDPSYYSLSETSVRDAEMYRLSMTLKDDDFGKKYSLENPSYTLTINKRTVDVSWSGSTSKTYDGRQLTITASATGVGEESGTELLFVNFGPAEAAYCLPVMAKARQAGVRCEIYPDSAKMKKQMSYANAKAIPYVAIAGENEMQEGKFTLKNMVNGEQSLVTAEELINAVQG